MFREHLILYLSAMILISGMQFFIVFLVERLQFLSVVESVLNKLPAEVQAFMGEQFFAQLSIKSAAAFGYAHPVVLTMFAIIAIIIPARHIAGEIENGTMEVLLAQPVSRKVMYFLVWVLSGFLLLILAASAVFGTSLAMWLYPQANVVSFTDLARLGTNQWLLMLSIFSLTIMLSAFSRESAKTVQQAAVIVLFFFFLDYFVKIWSDISILKYITLFTYFNTQKLVIAPEVYMSNILVLAGFSLIAGLIDYIKFLRRDIPG